MLTVRGYLIEHDGDEVQLALIENGVQVGGAVFPAICLSASWRVVGGLSPVGELKYPSRRLNPLISSARTPL